MNHAYRAALTVLGFALAQVTFYTDDALSGRLYASSRRVLRPGRYPSLRAMALNDRISSVRPVNTNAKVNDDRMAPLPHVGHDSRRRGQEALFEVPVTGVRVVAGPVGPRCWIEHVASPPTMTVPLAAHGKWTS
jgi:hypothetical protein